MSFVKILTAIQVIKENIKTVVTGRGDLESSPLLENHPFPQILPLCWLLFSWGQFHEKVNQEVEMCLASY